MNRLQEVLRMNVADIQFALRLNEGGGKGASAPAPVYTPPPAAPQPAEEATLDQALTPEEEQKKKTKAQKEGAKSLQIPLTSGTTGDTGTVGTGA